MSGAAMFVNITRTRLCRGWKRPSQCGEGTSGLPWALRNFQAIKGPCWGGFSRQAIGLALDALQARVHTALCAHSSPRTKTSQRDSGISSSGCESNVAILFRTLRISRKCRLPFFLRGTPSCMFSKSVNSQVASGSGDRCREHSVLPCALGKDQPLLLRKPIITALRISQRTRRPQPFRSLASPHPRPSALAVPVAARNSRQRLSSSLHTPKNSYSVLVTWVPQEWPGRVSCNGKCAPRVGAGAQRSTPPTPPPTKCCFLGSRAASRAVGAAWHCQGPAAARPGVV